MTVNRSEVNLEKEVKLLLSDDVFHFLIDPVNQREYDNLYQSCFWATAFQSRSFIYSWYKLYQGHFTPLIIYSRRESGILNGVLTMAISKKYVHGDKVKIIAAGEFESEYQVWLSDNENKVEFIKSALLLLMGHFPKCSITFRYIPEPSLVSWVENDPYWKNKIVLQSFSRPVLDLGSPKAEKKLRLQRQFKTKYNRLKREGVFSFKRVTDYKEFSKILNELMLQFDFRQGALFNKNQFKDNPLKAKFLMALFKEGILHVTVMRLGTEILASMGALADKNWVHLQGINTHSPFYSKFSPGILHLYFLGNLLKEERQEKFDLTPGYDEYKERWATEHDTVFTLTVAGDIKLYLKRSLKKIFHSFLLKEGIRPMSAELYLEKQLYLLKNKPLKQLFNFKGKSLRISKIPDVEIYHNLPVQKNNLNHLLEYNGKGQSLTRWEFTESSMKKLGEDKKVYTYTENNLLLACIYHNDGIDNINRSIVEYQIHLPEDAVILECSYCHQSFKSKMTDFLISVRNKILADEGLQKEVFIVSEEPFYF